MRKQLFLFLVYICISFCDDRITNLPGLPPGQPKFNQYAGYVTVDKTAGRSLFYWFAESQSNPSTDPVVLWLTGGPGCSSLIALLSENGPFHPDPDGKTLHMNPYSWNRIANVIWIESPAGVGFSYSNTTSDYNVGDVRAADDTYAFLLQFFDMYPQFKGRDFWVTGESYGGHYVPECVDRVLRGNQAGNPKINVKGFMAGNPWTYMPIDNYGAINTWWSRALVPQEAAMEIARVCDLNNVGPLLSGEKEWAPADTCSDTINKVMNIFSGIDIYDIYVDICSANRDLVHMQQYASYGSKLHEALLPKSRKRALDPCIDNHLTNYLNIPAVQQAIHARPTKWSECSSVVNYNYSDIKASVLPLYENFFSNYPDLKILVYSGDVDAIVPYWGTITWVKGFKRQVKDAWRAWVDDRGQVGGFVEVFDRFTFSTVRNAGHMVPWYQPERAWVLFSNFLKHGKLP